MLAIIFALLRPFRVGWPIMLIIAAFALAGLGLRRAQEGKSTKLAVPMSPQDTVQAKPSAQAKLVRFGSVEFASHTTPAAQAWMRGRELAKAGKPGEAIAHLEQALVLLAKTEDKQVSAYELYRDLGAAYLLTQQAAPAIKHLTKALDLRPQSVEVLNLRAAAYAADERWRRATHDLELYLKLRPNSDTAWVNLGAVADKRGQHDKALKAYQRALALQPNNEQAQLGQATMQARLGLYQSALPVLERLAATHPNELAYQMNCALAHYHTESLKAAVDGFTKVLRLDNGNTEALTLRGISNYRLGNQYGACRDWTKAASLGDSDATKALKKYCKAALIGRAV